MYVSAISYCLNHHCDETDVDCLLVTVLPLSVLPVDLPIGCFFFIKISSIFPLTHFWWDFDEEKTPNWQINWQHWKWQHRRQKTVNISLITVMIKAIADCRNVHSKLFYLDQNLRNFCLPYWKKVAMEKVLRMLKTLNASCIFKVWYDHEWHNFPAYTLYIGMKSIIQKGYGSGSGLDTLQQSHSGPTQRGLKQATKALAHTLEPRVGGSADNRLGCSPTLATRLWPFKVPRDSSSGTRDQRF